MIVHIVLFQPPSSVGIDERRAILKTVKASVEQCPTVRSCRVGRRVRHQLPGYEQAMRVDYEYALTLEFDDQQGLKDYLLHPAHRALGSIFGSASTAALAYDYEMTTLETAENMF
jgi:hypothetical protein